MGLLLSVLVACVGVIELVTFYYNVKRNVTLRPIPGDLSSVREGYIRGLYDVRKRIVNDLQKLQSETNNLTEETDPNNVQRPLPTLRLNSHEDIEVEYNRKVLSRLGPSGPRRFLVTEKEAENKSRERTPSPRRFVVSKEPQGIRKSKCKSSIPEFLIQEQNNLQKSPNRLRYVLKDHEGRSESPIPLPSQFVVTEEELDELDFSPKTGSEVHIRSPSPYPPLELPQTPRNSICNELVDHPVVSVVEVDEELCRSRSPSPRHFDDALEQSSFDSTQYWRNKVLVVPSKKSKSRSPSPACGKKSRSISSLVTTKQLETPEVEEFRSEPGSNDYIDIPNTCMQKVASNTQISEREDWNEPALAPASSYKVIEEENFHEDVFGESYLNNLDGVSKQKLIRRNFSSRKSIKRKNIVINDLEKPSSSKIGESSKSENTTNVSVSTVEERGDVSLTSGTRKTSEVADSSKTAENKTPEPFWVKN